MNCQEFESALHPYVDGELPVSEMTAAEAHAADCWRCGTLARREREFRKLLRAQPREVAPAALRASIRGALRRERRRTILRPWLVAPALAAAAAVLTLVLLPALRPAPSLVSALVDKHIAYAQLERPAELASSSPAEVAEWFRARASLRVVVPDYSLAGIHLVGARIADAHERKAAYLLYEKGRTLLSVFMVPVAEAEGRLGGRSTAFRGHRYLLDESKGYRSVAWTDGSTLFGLVSALDYGALLECADRLRMERARQTLL
jgi:anti-sigma factor RsiW